MQIYSNPKFGNDYPDLTEQQLEAMAAVMDDSIRESVHSEIAPCLPGEFLTEYLSRDIDFPVIQFATGHSKK